jgi:aerobic carbon-monoxide dehydrogenase medium subunit
MLGFEVAEPRSLAEAFDLLDPSDSAVRPMGGGTALMLMIKAQIFKPARLVNLRRLGGAFCGFSQTDDGNNIRIGAMTTFSELEHSPLIQNHFPIVSQTMKTLANVRVRNVASIGGNLAHADPHLDLPPVWLALDAKARIVSRVGERVVPVSDIFAGYYETTLEDGELISEIYVPLRPGWRSTYVKVTTRAAHDWPALGIAVSADVTGRYVKDVRLVLSAALDKPTRLRATENILRGNEISERLLAEVGDAAVGEVEMHSDNRGTTAYKNHLLRVHLARALTFIVGA